MSATRPATAGEHLPENTTFLVMVGLAPAIWLTHFVVTYITASIWCAKSAEAGAAAAGNAAMVQVPLGTIHLLVAGYTVLALAGILLVSLSGWRRHRHGAETTPHDMDTPGDRHRFLGFATVLLSGLSFLATLGVAVSTFYFDTCG
jgi:hypothetical protein